MTKENIVNIDGDQIKESDLTPEQLLVKAVQELSAQVEELKAKPRCKCKGE